jgi:hypothetical protein
MEEEVFILVQNIVEEGLKHIIMTGLTLPLPVAIKERSYDS